MAKIAIDVVLLPSEAVTDRAIEANRQLLDEKIVLDKECCLPHISLAMGCIEEDEIGEIEEILREIAEECALGRLKITRIQVRINSVGEKVSSFQIERTKSLQSLHEEILERLKSYLTYGITADMVLSPPISESTLRWIRDYRKKSSFEEFSPHITIGYGEIRDFSSPGDFTASKLALCRLGNHCTCREILASVGL